jgi:hypothetical protein
VRGGKVRRGSILLVLAALLAGAIVYDGRASSSQASAQRVDAVTDGPAVPDAESLSASWYCAEGTSSPDGRADETILIASVSDARTEATVTVMPGGSAAPVSRTVRLAARAEARVRVADLVATPEPAVVVEVVGGQAVVAHELAANDDVATEPCTRSASSDWYFAGGTTLKGSQQFVALFNPFGDDAIVDVTFLTDDGVQEPDGAQALVVPRRSRVSVPVHDLVPRQRNVAVRVQARSGRVVAERSQLFDGTASEGEIARRGIALSLGAQSPRRDWYFANGTKSAGAGGVVGVANFGASTTTVEVDVALEGDLTLPAQSISVPARGVVAVDVAAGVPSGSDYAVTVIARDLEGHSAPVVAELFEWWPESSASTGAATTLGSTRLARRWVVALPAAKVAGVVTVLDPGARPLTADLLVFDAGDVTGPPSAPERAVDAGRFAEFVLDDLGADGDHVLVVTADRPIAVGVTYTGPAGAAASAAIPDYGYGTR